MCPQLKCASLNYHFDLEKKKTFLHFTASRLVPFTLADRVRYMDFILKINFHMFLVHLSHSLLRFCLLALNIKKMILHINIVYIYHVSLLPFWFSHLISAPSLFLTYKIQASPSFFTHLDLKVVCLELKVLCSSLLVS